MDVKPDENILDVTPDENILGVTPNEYGDMYVDMTRAFAEIGKYELARSYRLNWRIRAENYQMCGSATRSVLTPPKICPPSSKLTGDMTFLPYIL